MAMIGTTAALYAHAIAIEREAVERYAEFAARMSDLGNEDVARLFTALARTETDHLKKLEAQAGSLALPAIDGIEHAWLDSGSPEAPARELVYRTMGPREALSIALASEQRAQALFLRVQRLAQHPALQSLAQEMAFEESSHVALIEQALALTPNASPDWEAFLSANKAAEQPVEHWHTDHVYFNRLLNLLEKQVDVFHDGGVPNYELMLDVVYYVTHFSDVLHHPREDAAFARLARRNPGLQLPVARLAQEHRVLAHIGKRLEQMLEQAAGGAFFERADLEALAATYLTYYRSHIAREERDILPLAVRMLTVEDWAAVRTAVPEEATEVAEARFRELRRQIALEQ
jgi:hemerythrin-like domain-containing protein/rubrerythrin